MLKCLARYARATHVLVVCGLVLLNGCDSTSPSPPQVETDPALHRAGGQQALDIALRQTLRARSAGNGLSFFTLPWSVQLRRIPQDPQNPLSPAKVLLGRLLFHETALGVNNVYADGHETYACASCHFGQGGFMANSPQGIAEGGSGFGQAGEGRTLLEHYDSHTIVPDLQPIRTPTVLNGAYQELMLWNGQFGGVGDNLGTEERWTPGTPLESNTLGLHGLETQAHAGLAVHRMADVELSRVASIPLYRRLYHAAFRDGSDPVNRLNTALAIAAYERTILANRAPFQRWLRGQRGAMNAQETRGAILFFGSAGCADCHTGPALNSMTFHALGMNDLDRSHDPTRVHLAAFAGTVPDGTRRGRSGFTGRDEDAYRFKTPQLYNLVSSPFLGHGASFASVREVVEYKNTAVPENPAVPVSQLAAEFVPLGLTSGEIDDLVAFLERALYDPDLMRYVPRRLPSGNCTPVNDPQARADLGCD